MAQVEQQALGRVAVVVVPFPAQGHLNQLLHFSFLLSTHNVPVHYAGSAIHNRQAKERIHGWDADALQCICFHDLQLHPFASPPPDPSAAIKFPANLQPLFEVLVHLQAPIASLPNFISAASHHVVVVYDPLMSEAIEGALSLPNVEFYHFECVSAFHRLSSSWGDQHHQLLAKSFAGCSTTEFSEFVSRQRRSHAAIPEAGMIVNSCRVIEGEFIDKLAQEPPYRGKKLFVIGPVNPVVVKKKGARHECLEWLDRQPLASVIYVAFGSTCTMSEVEIKELAVGLHQSVARFIWVLRDGDQGDIYAGNKKRELVADFDKKVEGTGIVVSGWAPQLEILAHPSTGAFMSHCGWNSCIESLSMGVPMLAWPMHSDQPRNAQMITEYLKVGLMAREWARREEIVSSVAIEGVIKRLMFCKEGYEMRRTAKALGEAVRQAVQEGGCSRADLYKFIAHITR